MARHLYKSSKAWALITGGSSGIGYEFSKELASMGYNLVIASRDSNRLISVAKKLKTKFKIDIEIMSVDLSLESDIEKLINRIKDDNRPIEVLINDAGFALHDTLIEEDYSRQMIAFSVMAEAVLKLSGAAAATMNRRGWGYIINVASTSAWLFAGNYSALKRWVVVYTQSLSLELEDTGVNATAVCPGWVKTDFHKRGGVSAPNIPNWLWVSPRVVVNSAFDAVASGKAIRIPTLRWKLIIFIAKHFESLSRLVSRRLVSKRIAEIEQNNVNK